MIGRTCPLPHGRYGVPCQLIDPHELHGHCGGIGYTVVPSLEDLMYWAGSELDLPGSAWLPTCSHVVVWQNDPRQPKYYKAGPGEAEFDLALCPTSAVKDTNELAATGILKYLAMNRKYDVYEVIKTAVAAAKELHQCSYDLQLSTWATDIQCVDLCPPWADRCNWEKQVLNAVRLFYAAAEAVVRESRLDRTINDRTRYPAL